MISSPVPLLYYERAQLRAREVGSDVPTAEGARSRTLRAATPAAQQVGGWIGPKCWIGAYLVLVGGANRELSWRAGVQSLECDPKRTVCTLQSHETTPQFRVYNNTLCVLSVVRRRDDLDVQEGPEDESNRDGGVAMIFPCSCLTYLRRPPVGLECC